jgi:hypothetical protein
VDPDAAPMTVQPALVQPMVERQTFEPRAGTAEPAPTALATHVPGVGEPTAPAARGRRKRPRVVAPAGPPRGAVQHEAASGEFGS